MIHNYCQRKTIIEVCGKKEQILKRSYSSGCSVSVREGKGEEEENIEENTDSTEGKEEWEVDGNDVK